MSKVSVKVSLENITNKEIYKKDFLGILRDEKLIYKEDKVLCEFLLNDLIYIRKINDFESFKFNFKEHEQSYIKYENTATNQSINIPLYTEKIVKNIQCVEILYQVDGNEKFHFILECR